MVASQVAVALRLLAMSTVTAETQWLIVYIQALHGVCFACFWIAAVDYAHACAPPGLKGTAQSLVSTSYYVVGPGVGSVRPG